MRIHLAGALACGALLAATLPKQNVETPTPKPMEMKLWPGEVPPDPAGLTAPDKVSDTGADGILRIRFVDEPTLTLYPAPKAKANGACVVVLPGGGYNMLAYSHEGTDVAEWLNTLGITAVVVKYRVPRRDPNLPHIWPRQDAQRAMRLTRSHAAEWGIDADRVGLLGFSAGGHLAFATGTAEPLELTYPRNDAADDLSARPDFLVPIYAAYLPDPEGPSVFPPEIQPGKDTPPTFMAVTLDDLNRGADAARMLIELKKYGVSAELHVFAKGGHGYGLRDTGLPVNQWPKLCADWMESSGFLTPGK
ncbi:MAG: acetyl esterase/lipase [Planctomycetota bacterium]|jgi:acetyl esterase/lipase